jgi:hypothetical protein
MYDIYEFSTNINSQLTNTSDKNSWISVGDLAGWMHNTYVSSNGLGIDIPYAIQQSYDKGDFAIGETKYRGLTVMGRTIKLDAEEWSVLAFLTIAKDEIDRRVPTYRFFFTQGDSSLLRIIQHVYKFELTHNSLPVFNPYKPTNLNAYPPVELKEFNNKFSIDINLEHEVKQGSSDSLSYVLTESSCQVEGSKALSLAKMHRLTFSRWNAIGNRGDFAWAYNSPLLKLAERFVLIQAADEESYTRLKSKSSGGIIEHEIGAKFGIDEEKIRTLLKSLTQQESNFEQNAPHNLLKIAEELKKFN